MSDASLPASDRDTLEHAARALGLDLRPAQADALLRYLALLQRWNGTYNLTAVRDPAQMLVHHIVDCLAVVPHVIHSLGAKDGARVLDVGSGAGLPGLVIAVMCPTVQVVCVDTVGKKAAFVRQAGLELGVRNLAAEHARVEVLATPPFDLITSRAFASLADFVSLTRHLLAPQGCWMAMKGQRPDAELAALPPTVTLASVQPLEVPGLQAERCLVWLRPAASAASAAGAG